MITRLWIPCLLLAVFAMGHWTRAADSVTPAVPTPLYELRPGTPDGLGKWFLGREIAHYMSHQGAPWLERPEREEEEKTSRVLPALKLRAGGGRRGSWKRLLLLAHGQGGGADRHRVRQ